MSTDEPSPGTHELLVAARTGDESASAALVEKLYPLVLRIVRSHRPPRTAEEDLCQMIFIRIFQNLHQYAGTAPFEHWVSRISVNTCLNQIEKERVRPELRHADLNPDQIRILEHLSATAEEIPEDDTETARQLTDQLLARLSPKDRLVVTLLHLDHRSVAEIKNLTGWSATSIKVRAFRARQKLKRLFASVNRQCT